MIKPPINELSDEDDPWTRRKGEIELGSRTGTELETHSKRENTFAWKPPKDEWHSIALGYTSGTTSSPKGVVLHHRGAYLMAPSCALIWNMPEGAIYLWTLPMFHCNGWCYAWTLAALCGTSICLRQVTAKAVYSAIANQGVTHFCAAPVVLNSIVNAPPSDAILPLPRTVNVNTAGAAPPPSVLADMTKLGFRVTHTYGLSETFGPSVVCAWKPEWDRLPLDERARVHSRQGVRYVGLEGLDVVDLKTMAPVPADGTTLGEIVMRGNVVMKGYLKNTKANAEAFAGGWYHSGDIGVKHPDGCVEVKDRAKDIIISGGENISSLEVESFLYMHPAILEVSVVARPDEQWGESPRDGTTRFTDGVKCLFSVRLCFPPDFGGPILRENLSADGFSFCFFI
ncbi:acetate--CoA ligase CCL3-like [Curcuma longa]|uniref:acetate--CoA ligase CCL3-like n=1 Tax=Curcuma longa TaxID=136217 RepID=UPI003D9DDD0B